MQYTSLIASRLTLAYILDSITEIYIYFNMEAPQIRMHMICGICDCFVFS